MSARGRLDKGVRRASDTDPRLVEVGLAGRGLSREQVVDIQRSRLKAGVVAAIEELGYERVTVGQITARARVSRRTFYELFANREECFVAVMDDVTAQVERELAAAGVADLPWRERVRTGLGVILEFLEREPVLARVCVVQSARASGLVQERRAAVLAGIAGVLDQGRLQSARGEGHSALTAEGLVGALLAIVQARLTGGSRGSFHELQGNLMGMIVLPYLGAAAARREQARPFSPGGRTGTQTGAAPLLPLVGDPLHGVPMRVTYRTARVLAGVHEHPGASNRQVAAYAGIGDPGQVSKLLRRLERLGLLENRGLGHAQGEPNAWWLTDQGALVARGIGVHAAGRRRAA
ncbi:MAG TPA: TetR/AcrR family transcriptional regulator [Solirubrobacteraceae bacterium]|jgi:AcrR family transcriptional regulator|nr:TetR/AcrR family transcriptional regulator [Solirubrobacteraceae bacterium]